MYEYHNKILRSLRRAGYNEANWAKSALHQVREGSSGIAGHS